MWKPVVKGPVDSNMFSIIAAASRAMKDAGQGDKVAEMRSAAMAGDYDQGLATIMGYVDFDLVDEDDEDDYDEYESGPFGFCSYVDDSDDEKDEL